MEEKNINEILNVENDKEIITEEKEVKGNSYTHEKTLKTIATIVLWVGAFATLICFFNSFPEKPQEGYRYKTEREFDIILFLITVLTAVSSVITWAMLNVISNISINLFKIKKELKQKKENK